MENGNNIKKAIEMVKNFDFYWRMDDYAYSKGLDRIAKSGMKAFKSFVHNFCGDKEDSLRDLWMARYNHDENLFNSLAANLLAA